MNAGNHNKHIIANRPKLTKLNQPCAVICVFQTILFILSIHYTMYRFLHELYSFDRFY